MSFPTMTRYLDIGVQALHKHSGIGQSSEDGVRVCFESDHCFSPMLSMWATLDTHDAVILYEKLGLALTELKLLPQSPETGTKLAENGQVGDGETRQAVGG